MTSLRWSVANALARAFLAGEWDPPAMTRRGQRAVGEHRVWVRDLAAAARHEYPVAPRDRPRDFAAFLAECPSFRAALARSSGAPRPVRWYVAPTSMGPKRWPVPVLDTVGDLQELLGYRLGELRWLADPRSLERAGSTERLRNYRYRWLTKPSGGLRLIEEPKPRLKLIQRVIVREILNQIPAHEAAHGFRKGRSALSYAAGHCGHAIVVHLDLEDFFGTITANRVYGIFRQCGYPEPVAHLLTALSTNSIPSQVWTDRRRSFRSAATDGDFRLGHHLAHPHLPQGAPTSPGLANLAAFQLDVRLAAMADASGVIYSRYADDLALSSIEYLPRGRAERLAGTVERILSEEGFRVNPFKTVLQRSGQRQRLAGVTINVEPNVDRRDYDRLKAVLHNCIRQGPASQNQANHPNFQAHLLGRVSHMRHINPRRGDRLLDAYSHIDWSSPNRSGPANGS